KLRRENKIDHRRAVSDAVPHETRPIARTITSRPGGLFDDFGRRLLRWPHHLIDAVLELNEAGRGAHVRVLLVVFDLAHHRFDRGVAELGAKFLRIGPRFPDRLFEYLTADVSNAAVLVVGGHVPTLEVSVEELG